MKIIICGIGAIGSNLTARLVADLKGEHEITVLDKDEVEERNLTAGTQFYTQDQIGTPKVEALQFNIYKNYQREIGFADVELVHENTPGSMTRLGLEVFDLIVDCFDNHDARQTLYDFAKEHNIPTLHAGFSDNFTFAIEWNEKYKVPTDITSGMDICEMPGAAAFVNAVASMTALVAEEFIRSNKKLEIVGGKFQHNLVT